MSSRLIYLFLLLLVGASLTAQTQLEDFERGCDEDLLCTEFELILERCRNYLEDGKGGAAYRELKALESCTKCPEHRDNLDAISREIVRLFEEQAQTAKEQNEELNQIVAQLQSRTRALNAERAKVDRQLAINKQMTREVLVKDYMRRARNAFESGSELGIKDAVWLTDFTYHYVDSTHHDVMEMQYDLLKYRLQRELVLDDVDENVDDRMGWEEEYYEEIQALSWSADERWLAVGTGKGRLVIFNVDGQIVYESMNDSPVNKLEWDPESGLLAFRKNDYQIGLLTQVRSSWQERPVPYEFTDEFYDFAWSPENSKLAVTTGISEIYTWEILDPSKSPIYLGNRLRTITDLVWSPDGEKLVSSDHGGYVCFWDIDRGAILHEIEGHSDYARAVDWHPDGHTIISAGDDGFVFQWDTLGQKKGEFEFDDWVMTASYSASGDKIGLTTLNGRYFTLLPETNERIQGKLPIGSIQAAWRGELNTGNPDDNIAVGFNSEAKYILSQGSGKQESKFGNQHGSLRAGNITKVQWSADGMYLAYGKDYELVIMGPEQIIHYDLLTAYIRDLSWHPGRLEGLPNSNLLVTLNSDDQVQIWDIVNEQIIAETELYGCLSVEWSSNGQYIAIGTTLGEVVLYDTSLEQVGNASPNEDYIRDLSWSPDSRYIATASDDYRTVIIDVQTMQELTTLSAHQDWIRSVCWIDDDHLVTAGDDDQAILWHWDRESGTGSILQSMNQLDGYYQAVDFFPQSNGGLLAVGTNAQQVGWWRTNASGQFVLDDVFEMEQEVTGVDWHPKGLGLAVNAYATMPYQFNRMGDRGPAYDGTAKDVRASSIDNALQGKASRLDYYFYLPDLEVAPNEREQFCWSADEQWLAIARPPEFDEALGQVELHHLPTKEVQTSLDIFYFWNTELSFSPNGRHLAMTNGPGDILVLNTESLSDTIHLRMDNQAEFIHWSWSANSRMLALIDTDARVHIFDVVSGQSQHLDSGLTEGNSTEVHFYPQNDRYVYVLSAYGIYELDRRLAQEGGRIYEPLDFTPKEETDYNQQLGAWLEDGTSLLFMRNGYAPELLEILPGKAILNTELGKPNNRYTWSISGGLMHELGKMPGGGGYYKPSELEEPYVWSLADGASQGRLRYLTPQVVDHFELSPNGQYLLTSGSMLLKESDKYRVGDVSQVIIWNLAEEKEVFTLETPGLAKVSFSPQGNYLNLHYNSGKVVIWPMNNTVIAGYLANSGKDSHLRQLSALDANIIADWDLEGGINLDKTGNMARLRDRETEQVRRRWSSYFTNEAWYAESEEEVEAYFADAFSLHSTNQGRTVYATELDTVAMVDVWLERAYYALYNDQLSRARSSVRAAARLQEDAIGVRMFEILLDWQNGNRTSLLEVLWSPGSEALYAGIENLEERDLRLRDRLLLDRYIAVNEESYDPVHPDREPSFKSTLPADLPADLQATIMRQYYAINTGHPGWRESSKRQRFLSEAAAYLEDLWEADPLAEGLIEELTLSLYALQRDAFDKKNYVKALRYAQRNLEHAERMIELDPSARNKSLYLESLGEVVFVRLQEDPSQAASLKAEIIAARNRYPDDDSSQYLEFQLAHCNLAAGETAEAYAIYFELLQYFGGNEAALIEQMGRELSPIAPRAWGALEVVLKNYEEYQRAVGEYDDSLYALEDPESAYEPEYLSVRYLTAFEAATYRYEMASVLLADEFLPEDQREVEVETYSDMAASYAHVLLYTNEWKEIPKLLEQTQLYIPEHNWQRAMLAVVHLLEGDWPATQSLLREVANLPNDGYNRYSYSTLGEYLLNLPEAVRESTAYQAHAQDWQRILQQ